MGVELVLSLLGGLALFMYGMQMMSTNLEAVAGNRMKQILERLTANRFLGVLVGAGITALIQSSSATTVMTVGFVNSGLMTLKQAVWIIMGANVGTTITGQLIALDIGALAPLIAFVGVMSLIFAKNKKVQHVGGIIAGIGVLFIGMGMMTDSVSTLRESELFVRLFTTLQNPILGVLAGTLVTVAVQSSSASVGILQALSSTGLVTWGSAIPIILGQNIGTTSTSLIASIGTSKAAKRSAMVHVYFNIIGTVIFMAAIYGVKAAVGFSWWNDTMNMGDIANFHTLFNVVVTLLFLPFTKLLAKLAEMTIPDKPGEKQDIEIPVLDERLFNSPAVAIQQAKSAVETMARNARANYGEAVPVLYSHNTEVLNLIQQRESVIDKLEVNISNYLVKVTDRELNESESHAVNELINFIVEYERIGDYAINVVERSGEMFDKEITFSESARRELSLVDNAIKEIMDITLAAFQADDTVLAEQVEPLEETIDLMIDTLRERHILRLKNGVCAIESGIIFLEILTNLERISDHCSNIAARIVGKESEDDHFDAHEFRRNMHDGYVPNFNEMLAQYKLKYYTPLLESQETA